MKISDLNKDSPWGEVHKCIMENRNNLLDWDLPGFFDNWKQLNAIGLSDDTVLNLLNAKRYWLTVIPVGGDLVITGYNRDWFVPGESSEKVREVLESSSISEGKFGTFAPLEGTSYVGFTENNGVGKFSHINSRVYYMPFEYFERMRIKFPNLIV